MREQQQGSLVASPHQKIEQFLHQWLGIHRASVRIRTYELDVWTKFVWIGLGSRFMAFLEKWV